MNAQIIVLAKTPVPGRVKTRLCPPFTPQQAAEVAEAALADTLDVVGATPFTRRILAVQGERVAPPGWVRLAQRGRGLGERIAHAFADAAAPGTATLLIGMDTPQVTSDLLTDAVERLCGSASDGAAGCRTPKAAAVLGPAQDGGWWLLGLNDPAHATALREVPMSTTRTGELTGAALRSNGVEPAVLRSLRDVDTVADAREVARLCPPGSRFTRLLERLG